MVPDHDPPPLATHFPTQYPLDLGNTHAMATNARGKVQEHLPLRPPKLRLGKAVTGTTKERHQKENKAIRCQRQSEQLTEPTWWSQQMGTFVKPPNLLNLPHHCNNMCPLGLALHHDAAALLTKYATLNCPTQTGKAWTWEQMQATIMRGPHASAMHPDARTQLYAEVHKKIKLGQARLVVWNNIKDNPLPELKISPVAMIPHKSRQFRAILDLSFPVKLNDGTEVPSVNGTSTKTGPGGAIDQIGHALRCIIHAFAATDPNAKIFMAKWDIKDGFWHLDCEQGQEWNFAYVLPDQDTLSLQLVVPTSLQMGWIESPPYFCTVSETARDIAKQYMQLPLNSLQ